ncbi:CoA transferase [Algiphilus sp.]|uniref:CoA transferase n=1 Tax=Algiphilus sp. TaxID=1872431 RepID=UPI003B51BF74
MAVGAAPGLIAPPAPSEDRCFARRYADGLLRDLGRQTTPAPPREHPAVRAAISGLHWLTGAADTPAQVCPVPLAAAADGTLAALRSLPGGAALDGIDGAALLTERAALLGLHRQGDRSAAGACRLLTCRDGMLAVHLARDSDWALLPAWLEREAVTDWGHLEQHLRGSLQAPLLERARWLGLPVTAVGPPRRYAPWMQPDARLAMAPATVPDRRPRVVDLSSLWAGPLCSHLLQRMGAEVIKVETRQRPDGARQGHPAFFDRLHAGKASVALALETAEGRSQLLTLLREADIVIEAARPRGLRQLGIHAEALLAERPGLTWIAITGYGREGDNAERVAFGDDAAMAAGLGWIMAEAYGRACFVGDALADPLTGLHAALAAWEGWLRGGGGLRALALRDVVGHVITSAGVDTPWRARAQQWQRALQARGLMPQPPVWHDPPGSAAALGADNARLLPPRAMPC